MEEEILQPIIPTPHVHRLSIIIPITILLTGLLVGSGIYFWLDARAQITARDTTVQITTLQSQINALQQAQIAEAQKDAVIPETKPWGNTYYHESLDITFEYPYSWTPETLTSPGAGAFGLNFTVNELAKNATTPNTLYAFGYNDTYDFEEHRYAGFSGCGIAYTDIDDFCQNGCERLNENIAIKMRSVSGGDSLYVATAYVTVSPSYPVMCFDLNLTHLLEEIGTANNIPYYEVADTYDISTMIQNGEVGTATLTALENFSRFVQTIRLK